MNMLLCPIHVTLRPVDGSVFHVATGLSTGKGFRGIRFLPPKSRSFIKPKELPSISRRMGPLLANLPLRNCREACIRSRRRPENVGIGEF